MKITVTTSLRIEQEDGDSTTIVETVRDTGGDNPRFEAAESARVLVVTAERVLDRMGGEEAVRRQRPGNVNSADRIYGPLTDAPAATGPLPVSMQPRQRDRESTIAMVQQWMRAAKANNQHPGQIRVFYSGLAEIERHLLAYPDNPTPRT
jgi:hypothetical protein